MNREQAHDEKISPLMTQIIAICKEHQIPFVASFQLDDNPDDPDDCTFCTSGIVLDEWEPSEAIVKAFDILRPRVPSLQAMLTTEHNDGTKTVTAFLG